MNGKMKLKRHNRIHALSHIRLVTSQTRGFRLSLHCNTPTFMTSQALF